MRIAGGTAALIAALVRLVPRDRVSLRRRAIRIALADSRVALTAATSDGSANTFDAEQVIAALPPRLLADIAFSPRIEPATAQRWRDTATWMAPHAKFFAVYDRPFWRDAGLSGTAQSFVGPLAEIHDATTASGKPALFGFLGVSADMRTSIGEAALAQACIQQLARLYGPDALTPRATIFKDWAADPFTATAGDRSATAHPHPTAAPWVEGVWQERLSVGSSETSATEPGFMAGAINAAQRAVQEVLKRLGPRTERSNS